MNDQPLDVAYLSFLLGTLLVLLAVLFLLLRTVWTASRSWQLLLAGDYERALPLCRIVTKAWVPARALAARHNEAVCLHHLGRLDEAEAVLRELSRTKGRSPVFVSLGDGLLGATLVLAGKLGAETKALLESSHERFAGRTTFAFLAHVAVADGDLEAARALAKRTVEEPPTPDMRFGWVMTRIQPHAAAAIEGYILGSLYEKLGDPSAARAAYAQAASGPQRSVYVVRAREALTRLGGPAPRSTHLDDDAEVASLGPFVSS